MISQATDPGQAYYKRLKEVLEQLYQRYNRYELIAPDPLQFVYRYEKPADMEIAGLLAAMLAYGRVQQIEKSLTRLIGVMTPTPAEFIRRFDKRKRRRFEGFKHRFNTGQDIADLCEILKEVLDRHGSIENFFADGYDAADENILPALSRFRDTLLAMHQKRHSGAVRRSFAYLLPGPALGSACKRLNLYLRWMVRDDDVDAGLWKSIDKARLIVPIDVHMGRLCRILGLYNAKTVSLSAALQITRGFAKMQPDDPAKYDFALSRIGIVQACNGRLSDKCDQCEIIEYCRYR